MAPLRQARRLRSYHLAWLLALAALLVVLAFWYTSAAAQTERSMDALHAALSVPPDVTKGKALYRRECASCHGRKAHGNETAMVPALAGQVPSYTIKQLLDMGEGDRSNLRMNHTLASEKLLAPAALANLAGHVATLPLNTRIKTGTGQQLERGQRTYAATCAHCHGPQGDGNAKWFVPALRGQHYSYLMTQMRQIGTSHRYAKPALAAQLLEAMSLEQLSAVADVASRLSVPPKR